VCKRDQAARRVRVISSTSIPFSNYLSIRELSALTAWTEQAIRSMIAKGVLREGEHFFHVGRRPVLKWDAIVAFIETGSENRTTAILHYRDRV